MNTFLLPSLALASTLCLPAAQRPAMRPSLLRQWEAKRRQPLTPLRSRGRCGPPRHGWGC